MLLFNQGFVYAEISLNSGRIHIALAAKFLWISFLLFLLHPVCKAGSIDSLYKIAEADFKHGNYDAVLQNVLQILKVAEDSGDCNDISYAMMKVARAYYHVQQKRVCLVYMHEARNLATKCNIDSTRYKSARQIGAVYLETGKPDSAAAFLYEAEKLTKKAGDLGELSSTYSLLGDLHLFVRNDTPKGYSYYRMAEMYASRSINKNSQAYAYMKLGTYYDMQDNCEMSVAYFMKAQKLYKEMDVIEGVMYSLAALGRALSDCGRAKESYEVMNELLALRNKIFKDETADNTARYRTLYETEKKERENTELARQNTLKELRIANEVKSKRLMAIFFISIALMLVIVFMYIYNQHRLRQQAEMDAHLKRQEEQKFRAVIEAEENERKRIAADLHDGVGQLMSAAKINLAAMKDELLFKTEEQRERFANVVAIVDESCGEVRTVSHNMMPNVLLRAGLANAIRSFISQIDNRYLKINLYIEGLTERVDSNIETILYRVIQECVNNVIKHAAASKLDISIIRDEEGISATIEDNGKGFDTTEKNHFEGIGLKNIASRVNYLKGSVEWDSKPGKGTVVAIFVPLKA